MTLGEWESKADWSELPDVYVTSAEWTQGMIWRIEACSVPMAIGPEVRLVRSDIIPAMIAEAVAREREALEVACQIEIDKGDKYGGPQYAAGARACRDAIRARKGDAT